MKGHTPKSSGSAKTTAFGAAHFISFVHEWGHPEWVVLAAEAPIEQVSGLYTKEHSAKQHLADVPVLAASKKDNEIAPLVAVVQPAESSWAVILRTLCLPIGLEDFARGNSDAETLSAKLKTRALVFIGGDTSYSMEYALYQNGSPVERKEWESQEDPADKAFAKLGLYLPGCYPRREGKKAWVAVTAASLGRIQRAELIDIPDF